MAFHRPRLCWRRGDAIFHSLNFEVSSRIVIPNKFAVSSLYMSCGKTRGYTRVCLIHSGFSGRAAKKDRVCLSVPRNRLVTNAIRLQQVWIGEQIMRIFWFFCESKYFLWQMRVNAVTHINRLLVERDIWIGVDDLPEGVGKYPPAKPPQISDVTIRKLNA